MQDAQAKQALATKSATKTPTSLLSSLAAMLSKLVFKGYGIGAGAGNGKRFTFPRRGFPSNVPTLMGEEPLFIALVREVFARCCAKPLTM